MVGGAKCNAMNPDPPETAWGAMRLPGPPSSSCGSPRLPGPHGKIRLDPRALDGKTLASAGGANLVLLLDVRTGEVRSTLKGQTRIAGSAALSPDGKTVGSGSMDTTI